jgi:hypothetical protein
MENQAMFKKRLVKIITVLSVTMLFFLVIGSGLSYALVSQNALSWYWGSDTNAAAVATGDVNGDGR